MPVASSLQQMTAAAAPGGADDLYPGQGPHRIKDAAGNLPGQESRFSGAAPAGHWQAEGGLREAASQQGENRTARRG